MCAGSLLHVADTHARHANTAAGDSARKRRRNSRSKTQMAQRLSLFFAASPLRTQKKTVLASEASSHRRQSSKASRRHGNGAASFVGHAYRPLPAPIYSSQLIIFIDVCFGAIRGCRRITTVWSSLYWASQGINRHTLIVSYPITSAVLP